MKFIVPVLLALAIALSGCQTPKDKEKLKQKELNKKAKAKLREETPQDVDFQAFVGRLRKAVAGHDKQTLKAMMTPNFGYKLPDWDGVEPMSGHPGVIQYWDDENLWPELDGILSEKFVKKGDFMVAPPQFADPSVNYDGYRAGIRRVGGSWKFAYFVNGAQ
jgi:hypothetical protein